MKAVYSVAFLLLVLGLLLPQTTESQQIKKVDAKALKAATPSHEPVTQRWIEYIRSLGYCPALL